MTVDGEVVCRGIDNRIRCGVSHVAVLVRVFACWLAGYRVFFRPVQWVYLSGSEHRTGRSPYLHDGEAAVDDGLAIASS